MAVLPKIKDGVKGATKGMRLRRFQPNPSTRAASLDIGNGCLAANGHRPHLQVAVGEHATLSSSQASTATTAAAWCGLW